MSKDYVVLFQKCPRNEKKERKQMIRNKKETNFLQLIVTGVKSVNHEHLSCSNRPKGSSLNDVIIF
jgi:hypothetical protein